MQVNKRTTDPEELKALALAYKQTFLDENGKLEGKGALVLRDLIRYSQMYQTTSGMSNDDVIRSKARADVIIYLMDTIFCDMDYFDNLTKLTTGEDYL
jgi:hypothetical protein